ncbi:hypothetical protein LIER_35625 [Lithospermum erythrorhizon]|uniref:Uncharacterized protein n=1 Tax=Lithospermum erythrorhizon TaxID=34254 RepID=A0AAV3NTM3_LITER
MFRQSASRAFSNIIQDTGCPVRSIKYSALVKRSVYRSSYDEAEMSGNSLSRLTYGAGREFCSLPTHSLLFLCS